MGMQAALKREAAAEQEKIMKQTADFAQQSIVTQQARFDAEMGIMKNRLAHENVSHSNPLPFLVGTAVHLMAQ